MKKVAILLMVLVLCVASSAFAESNSITTSDLTTTTGAIAPVASSAAAAAVTDSIKELVAKGTPAVEFFGADVQTAIAAKLPDVDLTKIAPVEIVGVADVGVVDVTKDLTVVMNFATTFTADQSVVVLCGVQKDGETTWTMLDAKVVDGGLQIVFPTSILPDVQAGNVVLTVLA